MAVSDYSTTASENTSLNGISVTDAALVNTVDNMIRELMADVAAESNITLKTSNLGTSVQAYDTTLEGLSGTSTAADKLLYSTAANTFAETDISSFGRALIDDADAEAARTTLELGSVATSSLPNITDLSVSGSSVARRDNVKDYGDARWLKARATIRYTGGTPSVVKQLNIASVTDNGVGDIIVDFTTPMADTDFTLVATVAGDTTTGGTRTAHEVESARTTSQVRLQMRSVSATSDAPLDPAILSIMVI